jgi:hypothetical protein
MTTTDWHELYMAFQIVSADGGGESEAFLCRATGKIHLRGPYVDEKLEEPPSGDLDDKEEYLPVPDKKALDLGKPLVLEFALERLPEDFDEIRGFFSRKGAYARFKDLLHHRGALDDWRAFEEAAEEKALRAWCAENGVEIDDSDRAEKRPSL